MAYRCFVTACTPEPSPAERCAGLVIVACTETWGVALRLGRRRRNLVENELLEGSLGAARDSVGAPLRHVLPHGHERRVHPRAAATVAFDGGEKRHVDAIRRGFLARHAAPAIHELRHRLIGQPTRRVEVGIAELVRRGIVDGDWNAEGGIHLLGRRPHGGRRCRDRSRRGPRTLGQEYARARIDENRGLPRGGFFARSASAGTSARDEQEEGEDATHRQLDGEFKYDLLESSDKMHLGHDRERPQPSAFAATGRITRAHSAYMAPEGCRPSDARRSGSEAARREIGVRSTNVAPASAVSSRTAELNRSISAAIRVRSRSRANGVTPQSGMERTITRDARPSAKRNARSSSDRKRWRKSSACRPRY